MVFIGGGLKVGPRRVSSIEVCVVCVLPQEGRGSLGRLVALSLARQFGESVVVQSGLVCDLSRQNVTPTRHHCIPGRRQPIGLPQEVVALSRHQLDYWHSSVGRVLAVD